MPRTPGSWNVSQLPNGKWRARYIKPDGKERAGHFDTKKAGERWCRAETAAIETGTYVDPNAGRVTFRTFADKWLADTEPGHRRSTHDRLERTLRLHVYPVLGDQRIGDISSEAVQSFVTVASQTLAPDTLRVTYSVVVSIFRAAVDSRRRPDNPCMRVTLPKREHREVEVPPIEVLDKLAAALPDRLAAVVPLVAGSGLRFSEVAGLEVERVDFLLRRNREVPVVQQLVSPDKGAPFLAPVKTKESRRRVPLAQVTLDALTAHREAFPAVPIEVEDQLDRRRPHQRTAELIFTLDGVRPLTRNRWSAVWAPAARAAGLPPGTGLHVLRHLYASLLIEHGASVKIVQKRLGHSSAKITLDTYSHLWPDADDTTRAAVEAALGQDCADSVRTLGQA